MDINFYSILKLSDNADVVAVKKAFCILKEEAAENFRKIHEAYNVLSEERKREPKSAAPSYEYKLSGGVVHWKKGKCEYHVSGNLLRFFSLFLLGLPVVVWTFGVYGSTFEPDLSLIYLMEPEEVLNVDVKPGWKKGTRIIFEKKGERMDGYKDRGDFVLVVDEKPHNIYKRVGNNLIIVHTISLYQALTVKNIAITTLDGRTLNVLVDDIVTPNYKIKVPDEGMPVILKPGKKGKLIVQFHIAFPKERLTAQKHNYLAMALEGNTEATV
ncbi:hypothetical protein GIB67_032960 [Kingdonia uniflora]|uniref:Chaperone DnaJ C-terminal domain-containing protein n=1 Tax=Kingdonia uniflora TaxID=39325 RepID=A0A7J7MYD1_9MAGN|nr:hypothetical protein GIB67_032960 [Kingdonia uniflora]